MNTDLSLGNRPDLATERLSLRRPNDRDVDAIVGVVGDWEVARRLARVPHPYGPADARFFLDYVVPAEWVWAVTLRGSDTLLGAIGLTPEEGADAAELGYWLSSTHWGSGVNRRPKRTPYRRPKETPFVGQRDGNGRAVRAGCGVGRA